MRPTLREVLMEVCGYYNVGVYEVCGRSRSAQIKDARHMYMYVAYRLTGLSTIAVAEFVNRDHSTCLYVLRKYNGYMTHNERYAFDYICNSFTSIPERINPTIAMYSQLGRYYHLTLISDFTHRLHALNPVNKQERKLKIAM